MNSERLALLIISNRKWRNGHLKELTDKALRGVSLTREADSDMSPKEWDSLTKPPQERPTNSSVTKPERVKNDGSRLK